KMPPRLDELTGARFELLFQLDQCGLVANVRSRLRSGRTKLAAARWAICAFARQGHLVGTVSGPPPFGRPSQRSSLSILTEPNDELAPFHARSPRRRDSRNGCYGILDRGPPRQSGLMLPARITLPHFSVSSAMSLPKSAGEPASALPPDSAIRALILGSARAALVSWLSLSMVSAGVPLGEPRPRPALAPSPRTNSPA